jgi:hypothetical protein
VRAVVIASRLAWRATLTFVLASAGCAPVAPYQRSKLASPCMEQVPDMTSLSTTYRAKVLESKVGGGLPGTAPGGGCGCTQ